MSIVCFKFKEVGVGCVWFKGGNFNWNWSCIKFFFLLLNVKSLGVIVYDSFIKLFKNIKNYRLLLKMKRKKMCKVNDNLVILIIESIILEVFFYWY